jgi:hypothetical protein
MTRGSITSARAEAMQRQCCLLQESRHPCSHTAGRKTIEGMPAAAQYADRAAEVSPVDAHPTAVIEPGLSLRMRLTWLTRTVIPRSLKLPVWELPHCLTHRSLMPNDSLPNLSAQNKLLLPSNMLTMSSSEMPCKITDEKMICKSSRICQCSSYDGGLTEPTGKTHSFLLHTPDP